MYLLYLLNHNVTRHIVASTCIGCCGYQLALPSRVLISLHPLDSLWFIGTFGPIILHREKYPDMLTLVQLIGPQWKKNVTNILEYA